MPSSVLGEMIVRIVGQTAQFDSSIDKSGKKFKGLGESVAAIGQDMARSLRVLEGEAAVWGNSIENITQKQMVLKQGIRDLIASGVDPLDDSIEKLQNEYFELGNQAEELAKKQAEVQGSSGKLRGVLDMLRNNWMIITAAVGGAIAAYNKVKQVVDQMEADFAEAEKTQALLANTIKTTGANAWTSVDALNAHANSIANMTTYTDDAVGSLQNILLGFRNITGDEFRHATEAALDMATVMGMDMVSAAQAIGKALDNPAQGLDSLSKQGFKFTEQEKEMMKQMQLSGDIAGAQKIILGELDKTYGGAAKTAGELASALKTRLKNATSEVSEEMGEAITMALVPFRTKLLEIVSALAEAIAKQNEYNKAVKNIANGAASAADNLLVEEDRLKSLKNTLEDYESGKFTLMPGESLDELKAAIKAQELLVESLKKKADAQKLVAKAAEDAKVKTQAAAEEEAEQIKNRDLALADYKNKEAKLQADLEQGLIDEAKYRQELVAINQELVGALRDLNYFGKEYVSITGNVTAADSIGNKEREKALNRINEHTTALQELNSAEVESGRITDIDAKRYQGLYEKYEKLRKAVVEYNNLILMNGDIAKSSGAKVIDLTKLQNVNIEDVLDSMKELSLAIGDEAAKRAKLGTISAQSYQGQYEKYLEMAGLAHEYNALIERNSELAEQNGYKMIDANTLSAASYQNLINVATSFAQLVRSEAEEKARISLIDSERYARQAKAYKEVSEIAIKYNDLLRDNVKAAENVGAVVVDLNKLQGVSADSLRYKMELVAKESVRLANNEAAAAKAYSERWAAMGKNEQEKRQAINEYNRLVNNNILLSEEWGIATIDATMAAKLTLPEIIKLQEEYGEKLEKEVERSNRAQDADSARIEAQARGLVRLAAEKALQEKADEEHLSVMIASQAAAEVEANTQRIERAIKADLLIKELKIYNAELVSEELLQIYESTTEEELEILEGMVESERELNEIRIEEAGKVEGERYQLAHDAWVKKEKLERDALKSAIEKSKEITLRRKYARDEEVHWKEDAEIKKAEAEKRGIDAANLRLTKQAIAWMTNAALISEIEKDLSDKIIYEEDERKKAYLESVLFQVQQAKQMGVEIDKVNKLVADSFYKYGMEDIIYKQYNEMTATAIGSIADQIAYWERLRTIILESYKQTGSLTDEQRNQLARLNVIIAEFGEQEANLLGDSLKEGFSRQLAEIKSNLKKRLEMVKAGSEEEKKVVLQSKKEEAEAYAELALGVVSGISDIMQSISDLSQNGVSDVTSITDTIGGITDAVGSVVSSFDPVTGAIIKAAGAIIQAVGQIWKAVAGDPEAQKQNAIKAEGMMLQYRQEAIQKGLEYQIDAIDKEEQAKLQALGYVDEYGNDLLDKEYDEKNKKIDKELKKELKALGYVDEYGNDVLDKEHEKKMSQIDAEMQAELQALGYVDQYGNDLISKKHQEMLEDIDEREKKELEALGVVDRTDADILAEKIDAKRAEIAKEVSVRKQAILERELQELLSEKNIANVRAKYENERIAADIAEKEATAARAAVEAEAQRKKYEEEKKYKEDAAIRDKAIYDAMIVSQQNQAEYEVKREERDKIRFDFEKERYAAEEAAAVEMRKYNREKAIYDKDLAIANVEVARQKAIADLGTKNQNSSMRTQLDAGYNDIISKIKSVPIPAAAEGGIVQPVQGGQLVRVAEARKPEAIIPLDRLNEMLANIEPMRGVLASGGEGDIILTVELDSKPILAKIFPATRNRQILIDARSIVNGGLKL